jgi:hypothetical protein
MKYKIKTKKGNEATLEAKTMIQMTEAARQFCHSKGEGWPGSVVLWEHVIDVPIEPKRGKKYEYDK